MVRWPAIIHINGEDELIMIRDERKWQIDSDQHFHPYSDSDIMMDSVGCVYRLSFNNAKKRLEIKEEGSTMDIKEFELLIKRHLSVVGQCCISKITIATYMDGFNLIDKTID